MNEELIRELESITISENVYIKARNVINNYWTHSEELIVKKLVRNWIIGEKLSESKGYETRRYGNLTMILDKKTGVIMHLRNNNYEEKECLYDKELKKKINRYMGIDQMIVEEGIKGNAYRHLPIFSKRVFYKYRRFFGSENTYLDVRKAFGELVANGTITEQTEEYKYISTAIGKVKVYGENYISYIDVNEDIVNATREEVA